MDSTNIPEVSLIICTYNRSAMLARALESACTQTLPFSAFEVVVVDNASTDDTKAVVQEIAERNPDVVLRLVDEEKQGLGHARNKGLRVAQADYVAYLDDDAVATEDWLESAMKHVHRLEMQPAAIGGPILPLYESPKPDWFRDEYETRTQGPQARYLDKNEYLSGSNMILNKSVVESYGGFAEDAGMRGDFVSLGEETVLFRRMYGSSDQKDRLYYAPDVIVRHSVPATRMSVRSRLARYMIAGYQDAFEYRSRGRSGFREFFATILGALRMSIAVIVARRRYTYWQRWAVEECGPLAASFGKLARLLHVPIRVRR